jgi:hypothetical protein
MTTNQTIHESRDLLRNWWIVAAVYWLPVLVIIASGFLSIGQGWRGVLWAAALTTMSLACLANAIRCGRVHCYFTAPFFLIMAIVAILYGFGVVSLGQLSWNLIGILTLIGFLLLFFVPERLAGTYRR